VIEFALLFGLGFLSAALLAMLVAPAIHRRIVRYTENRIKATLPISPQEVRAQRDMARAIYAAENARTKQELVQERDKTVGLQIGNNTLIEEMRRLQSEAAELRAQLDLMDTEAAEARSRLRQEENRLEELKATIEALEEAAAAKDLEIENLQQRQLRLVADADNFRIDLSTRDTEVENLKFRMIALRDERDTLRNDLRLQTTRAKDAETRLAQEENRVQRLEDKLSREVAERTDRENALERRLAEIARLREKLKVVNAETREASRTLREAAPGRPGVRTAMPRKKIAPEDVTLRELPHASPKQTPAAQEADKDLSVAEMREDVHNRALALSERLQNDDGSDDEAIRRELASVAANMVALTAITEGSSSPIHTILSGKSGTGKRESLAAKAKRALTAAKDAAE